MKLSSANQEIDVIYWDLHEAPFFIATNGEIGDCVVVHELLDFSVPDHDRERLGKL